MVDVTSDAGIEATASAKDAAQPGLYESDFSARKIRVALIILLGQTFATSILPFVALTFVNIPMTTEFGWTQQQFAYATTSLMYVGAISVLFLGWAVDHVGTRPIIILGTVIVGLVTMSISQVSGLATFCLAFAALGFSGSTGMVYAKVIAGLFGKHRGKALAIFGAESAVAAAITPLFINYLIAHYGWRGSFFVEGIIILAIAPLLYFFLDEVGTAGGSRDLFKFMKAGKTSVAAGNTAPSLLEGMTLKAILKDRVFWLLVVATLIAGAPRGGLFIFLAPMLQEHGFDGQAAAGTFTALLTAAAAGGAIVSGLLLDKYHTTKLAVPFKIMALVALVLLGVATMQFGGTSLLLIAGLLWGVSDGAMRPMGTYFNTRLFGLKAFGGMMGVNSFIFSLFLGTIAPLVGRSRDVLGSYEPAVWAISGLLVVGAVIYLIIGPYRYGVMVGATKADGTK